jgi:hypothetical protein
MMFLHGVFATLATGNTIVAELDKESYMAKKRTGILTGGGDVPGLNSVIKSVVYGRSRTQKTARPISVNGSPDRGWTGVRRSKG